MNFPHPIATRRGFLKSGLALSAAFWTTPGLFAEELARTPQLTEGPFYPDKLPLDKDNDLIIVGNSTTPALGEVTHLSGRILSQSGEPIRDATIEIWQVDAKGIYLNSRDNGNGRNRDANFQGFRRASPPARPANIASARSSRCRIRAARRIFTSR